MITSDHRHPGAKKRKFPLIVGPPFIHATNPATSTSTTLSTSTRDLRQFDCSTRGMDLLATRQPEAEPILFLAQGKLNPRFELIQR
jgi:hypothetical protein